MNINRHFTDDMNETEAKLLKVTVFQPARHIHSGVEALISPSFIAITSTTTSTIMLTVLTVHFSLSA